MGKPMINCLHGLVLFYGPGTIVPEPCQSFKNFNRVHFLESQLRPLIGSLYH